MKKQDRNPGRARLAATLISALLVGGCSSFSRIELAETEPYQEVTVFSEALYQLGRMSLIYNAPVTSIQSSEIFDATGASHPLATGGEIQQNITEIVKSTLNSLGGRVTFVDYDPTYVNNQITTGYSDFENRIIPDLVVTGGITGFDRAMETVSGSGDAAMDLQFPLIQGEDNNPVFPPSQMLGGSYSDSAKRSVARISVDFNLKGFESQAGIPYMSVTNSILVRKGLRDRDLSVTLFGPSFGLKGSMTKVQGRHQAVRLLVQSSMIHLVGRYLALPYWRLLGEEAEPDRFVIMQLRNSYARMTPFQRLVKVQSWLLMQGYDVNISGEWDEKTLAVLSERDEGFDPDNPAVSRELFEDLYLNMPLEDEILQRRLAINAALERS